MKELVQFIASNIAKEISYNAITKILGIRNPTTVKEYFQYLENCYLAFLAPAFEFSLRRQTYGGKKMYLIDNGLARHLGHRFSGDIGRMLENLVYVELRRRKMQVLFRRADHECVFVITKDNRNRGAIRVCHELHDLNREREVDGLVGALRAARLKEGLILTHDQDDAFRARGKSIVVRPVWKWLLGPGTEGLT